jgi:PST family polysaccharide transporter
MMHWGLIGGGIAIVSIVAGLPWGAAGVAATYAASDLFITTPLLFWYAGRRGPVRAGDFYRTIAAPACAAVCSLAVLTICRPWLGLFGQLFTRLSVGFLITVIVSFLVLAALPAGREAMRSFKAMLGLLVRKERASVV